MTAELIVRAVRGLEWVVAAEVAAALPASAIRLEPRQVRCRVPGPEPAVLGLATADDAFVLVDEVGGVGHTRAAPARLAEAVAAMDLAPALAFVGGERRPTARSRFDVVASLDGRRNFSRYDVEEAVGARLAPRLGRPVSHREGAAVPVDTSVRIFLHGPTAAVALRVADRPLHRRAWKAHTGRGSLHPPVAAALARLACPVAGETVLDPFCGDGTVAIELARLGGEVVAADLDPARLANTAGNARLAGVRTALVRADAARPPWAPGGVDVVASNPPWNVAVEAGGRLSGSLAPWWRACAMAMSSAGRLALLAPDDRGALATVTGQGFREVVVQHVRIAGRVAVLGLYAGPASAPSLAPDLAAWRARSEAAGVTAGPAF